MTSKTRMLALVKAHDWAAVERALAEQPALLGVRDERGRGWLHIACATPPKSHADVAASIATADVLLAAGLEIDDAAFTEGQWRATPLWYAIGCGRNLALAEHLLKEGCDPEHCLWAAGFNRDAEAIRLLVRHGASLDPFQEGTTPFLGAVKCSHFAEAEVLLELGADVDHKDDAGLTALHLMLKKGSDARWLEMLARHGARGDIADPEGRTAIEILRRKRDPAFHAIADRLAANGG
ncbi:MAG TPA: ankyrin repeat domain-containing protein [Caulobacteraceae bacterium]|nr:ankyrin repeat domain-containing protein [Caulobacteraceae bacterium]